MRGDRPSLTAEWVAACRGLAGVLPPGEHVCDDPWGLRFGGPAVAALGVAARLAPHTTWGWFRAIRPAALSLYWAQLRTREIDDLLLAWADRGGAQVVVLGAGYDARAVRLRARLPSCRVFEVDHPATQARKRRVLGHGAAGALAGGDGGALHADGTARRPETGPRYVAWDLEHDPMAALGERLASVGHDATRPTFTIWEGVTMYLTERAVEDAVAAIRGWSSAGSELAFEYLRRSSITGRPALERLIANAIVLRDEPFRFGWEPPEIPAWLAARGLALVHDRSDLEIARARLSPRHQRAFAAARGGWEFHLALARRA